MANYMDIFQPPWLFVIATGAALVLRYRIRDLFYSYTGRWRDTTEVEPDDNVWLRYPMEGDCLKISEKPTGETERRADGSYQNKLELTLRDQNDDIFTRCEWEDNIRPTKWARNGSSDLVYEVVNVKSIAEETNVHLNKKIGMREAEIVTLMKQGAMVSREKAKEVGAIVKETRQPMFFPRSRQGMMPPGSLEGGEVSE